MITLTFSSQIVIFSCLVAFANAVPPLGLPVAGVPYGLPAAGVPYGLPAAGVPYGLGIGSPLGIGAPVGIGSPLGIGGPLGIAGLAPAVPRIYGGHSIYNPAVLGAPVYPKAILPAPVVHKAIIPPVVKHVVAQPIDPNPQYSFSYGVSDPHTGDNKHAEETLVNGVVHGSYSLTESDGTIRKVTYTADKINGFNAVVEKTGVAHHAVPAVAKVLTPAVHAPAVIGAPAAYATGYPGYH